MVDRVNPHDPARVICTKVESPRRWAEAGWLHVLKGEGRHLGSPPTARRVHIRPGANREFAALATRFERAMSAARLATLATILGLSPKSLQRLGVGWADAATLRELGTGCCSEGCWTFPMSDAEGRVVGIRLRTHDGFKYAVRGSEQGLFLPANLDPRERLLIAEGASDACALLDLGLEAVGRPSCTGGAKELAALIRRHRVPQIVIVSDNDEPGMAGAEALAASMRMHAPQVRVIKPPAGTKDAREWSRMSPDRRAVAAVVNDFISAVPARRLTIRACRRGA